MRKIFSCLRWLAVAVGFLALLAAIGLTLYTRTDAFRELLREQLLALINDSVRGSVAIERVEGSPWGRLTLHNVQVRHREAEIAEVPRLEIRYSLLPLLWKQVQFSRVEAFQPRLHLRQNDDGSWNVVEALAPIESGSDEPFGYVISLKALALRNASIDIVLAGRQETKYRLSQAELHARLGMRSTGLTVDVRKISTRLLTEDLPEFRVHGALSYQDTVLPATLRLKELWLEIGGSRVKLAGKLSDFEAGPILDSKISVERIVPADMAKLLPPWPLKREIKGTIDVKGPLDALTGTLALTAAKAKMNGNLTANLGGKSPSYSANVTIRDFNVRNLLGIDNVAGIVSGRLAAGATGTALADISGWGDLKIDAAEIDGWKLGDVSLKGDVRRSVATLTGAIESELGGAEWRGRIILSDNPRYDLALSVNELNIRKVTSDDSPLEGKINLKGTIKGAGFRLRDMNSEIKFQILPSTVGPVDLDRGTVAATLRNRRIHLSEATFHSKDATLSLKGEVGTEANHTGQLDYHLRVSRLSPWLTLVGRQGSGSLELTGLAFGNLTYLNFHGQMKLAALELRGLAVRNGTIGFDLNHSTARPLPHGTLNVSLTGIDAGVQLRSLEAMVRMTEAQPYTIEVDARARDQHARSHALSAKIERREEGIAATLDRLSLALPDGMWRLSRPGLLSIRGDDFFIERFLLQNASRQLSLGGLFSLTGKQSLALSIEGLPLDAWKGLIPRQPELKGILSARAQVSGTAGAPEINGSAELREATIAGQSYAGLVAKLSYKDETVHLNATLRQDSVRELEAIGTFPLILRWQKSWQSDFAGNLDLRIQSTGLSIAFLNAFSGDSAQDISGEIALDLLARGSWKQPVVKGNFRFRDGRVKINPLGVRITSITADGAIEAHTVKIHHLSARAEDGKLNGSGSLGLRDYRPGNVALALTLDRWPVIETSRYQATLNGKLGVGGPFTAPEITGSLEVAKADLRPDLDFLDQNTTPMHRDKTITVVRKGAKGERLGVEAAESDGHAESDWFQNTRLDLTLSLPRNVWIRHRNANAELSGKIRARKKSEEEINLAGTIEVVRGWIGFQGRRFNLVQGKIVFTGAEKIDPSLDILAQYRLRDYIVEAIVSGTVEKPSLSLRSQPRLDQADILALLLFGKPIRELNQGEQVSLQQSAIDITSGYAAARIGTAVAQALGLERLGIEIGDFDFTGGRIGYGRYVTRKTYVSLSQELDDERGREFSVEYQIAPDWKIRSSTSPTGDRGVDIFWHKQY